MVKDERQPYGYWSRVAEEPLFKKFRSIRVNSLKKNGNYSKFHFEFTIAGYNQFVEELGPKPVGDNWVVSQKDSKLGICPGNIEWAMSASGNSRGVVDFNKTIKTKAVMSREERRRLAREKAIIAKQKPDTNVVSISAVRLTKAGKPHKGNNSFRIRDKIAEMIDKNK